MKKYFIKTYGCQMNVADEEQIAGWYESQRWQAAQTIDKADEIVIVTCSVRQTAEDRVYGLINNLSKNKKLKQKIILTGCMLRYPLKWLKEKMPQGLQEIQKNKKGVDPFLIHVWESGCHSRLAELIKDDEPEEAKKHLQQAEKIANSDEKLIIRRRQIKELAKNFKKNIH